jgi:amidase
VAAGAEVVLTDFPLVTNYEGDRPGAPTLGTRGLVSPAFLKTEILDLSAWAWDDFLRRNADPRLNRLADVDEAKIFPRPPGALPDRYTGFDDDIATYPAHARAHPCADFRTLPHLAEGLRGLEETRRRDLDEWMDRLGLDAVIFPALADVGPADADVNPASADLAWRNGVWVANGNLAIRHMGVPTVTLPMGVMADTGMPMGLTLAGRGGDDAALMALALAVERLTPPLPLPPRTPALDPLPALPPVQDGPAPRLRITLERTGETLRLEPEVPLAFLSIAGRLCDPALPLHPAPARGGLLVAVFETGHAVWVEPDLP